MKKQVDYRQAAYGPLVRKTFRAALARELSVQIPPLGTLTADALAGRLEQMFLDFFPPAERLRMGQTLWPAIDEKETAAHGKRIEDCCLKPVLLDIVTRYDILQSLKGVRKEEIRKKVVIRLFEQAKDQGAVLTCVDVAALVGLTPNTVSCYVLEHERKTGTLVPRRGTVHDMGPSVTHKREICRQVILEGKSIEDTARATRHSPEAVTRYVQDYRRVSICFTHGLSISKTAYATNMSKKLVNEYIHLQQHPLPSKPEEEI